MARRCRSTTSGRQSLVNAVHIRATATANHRHFNGYATSGMFKLNMKCLCSVRRVIARIFAAQSMMHFMVSSGGAANVVVVAPVVGVTDCESFTKLLGLPCEGDSDELPTAVGLHWQPGGVACGNRGG